MVIVEEVKFKEKKSEREEGTECWGCWGMRMEGV